MPQEIKPGVLAVTELPEDAREFNIGPFTGNLNYFTGAGILMSSIGITPGQWSIVGWSDELTGGQIYELGLTVREFKESLRSQGITNRALIIKNNIVNR